MKYVTVSYDNVRTTIKERLPRKRRPRTIRIPWYVFDETTVKGIEAMKFLSEKYDIGLNQFKSIVRSFMRVPERELSDYSRWTRVYEKYDLAKNKVSSSILNQRVSILKDLKWINDNE